MACCALCCRVVMFVMKAGDTSHVLGIFSWDWLRLRRSPGSVVTCVHLKLFCENYFSLGLSRAGLWQFPMTRTRARDTSQSSHALSALCSVLVAARQSWAELGRAGQSWAELGRTGQSWAPTFWPLTRPQHCETHYSVKIDSDTWHASYDLSSRVVDFSDERLMPANLVNQIIQHWEVETSVLFEQMHTLII